MDAQAASMTAAEAGSSNLSSGISTARKPGSRRDGIGVKNPSGHQQQWMALQKGGVSASAPRSEKETAAALASNGTSSQITSQRGAPPSASSNTTTQFNRKSVRASDGPQANALKPNDDAKQLSSNARNVVNSSGAMRIAGVRSVPTEPAERRFVPYLPQDDAVVAGFGEREGGVDASETQQAVDLLNEQLHDLLLLPPRQFWERVNSDESLGVFLDSYLHFKRRWFDKPLSGTTVGAIAGDGDLSRRVFMVLLRISSREDSEISADAGLSANDPPWPSRKRSLFDIPKLMDIVAIYGRDNPDLTRQLVGNAFQAQPKFSEELAAYIPPLLERMMTTYNRCLVTVEDTKNRPGKSIAQDEATRVRGELLEIIDFFNDVAITLKAFVEAYPPAAETLIFSRHGQDTILLVMVNIHDTLLPNLLEGLTVLEDSSAVLAAATLGVVHNLPNNLGDLTWKLLEFQYIERSYGQKSDAPDTVHQNRTDEDALQAGDNLLSTVVTLAEGSAGSDSSVNGNDHESSTSRSTRKGGLLCNIERRHKLSSQILQADERGALVLSEQLQHQLLKILSDVVSESNNESSRSLPPTHQLSPDAKLAAEEVEKETAIQQSKISQVKDLFPDFGDGFILACLEAYDNDPERVIQQILEGTLHPDLAALDTSLMTRPEKAPPQQPSKDKGKGKMIEQQPDVKEGNAAVAWGSSKSSLAQAMGGAASSNLSLPSKSGSSATQPREASQKALGSELHPQAVGRYVLRQQQESGSFNELLDRRNENQELRASMRAVINQFEYEDEYDDSFDELNEYVADAGGNEEAESLADQIAGRGREEQNRSSGGGIKRSSDSGRPVILTPWGSDTGKGRVSSGPPPKPKFESQKVVPVPEVQDGVSTDQAPDSSSSQGRGGGRGGGRGKKKWKEQGPKPTFYMKDGKLYSYKVAGAIGVSSIEEADAIKFEEEGLVHGLGAGGNIPLQPEQQQQDNKGNARKKVDSEESSKPGQGRSSGDGERYYRGQGDGGRGRGAASHGKDNSGRSSHGRREDNHRRKDQAMKKHFGGVGGF